MTVAYPDSHPTLYVVHGRAKPVLHGPNSTEPTCSIMEKPHTGLDDCPNMLLSCFRKMMSGVRRRIGRANDAERTNCFPPLNQHITARYFSKAARTTAANTVVVAVASLHRKGEYVHTVLRIPLVAIFCLMCYGKFLPMVGRYCSYCSSRPCNRPTENITKYGKRGGAPLCTRFDTRKTIS